MFFWCFQTVFTSSTTINDERWQFLINIDVRSMMSSWISDTSNFSDRLVQIQLGVEEARSAPATDIVDNRAAYHKQAEPAHDAWAKPRL